MDAAAISPPDFLQLAGHPLRWQLLSLLARSDRTVRELTGMVAEAQNLVSYHLGKLREAGLVFTRRSSFDGRDTWYAVDLVRFGEHLAASATALHPGLGAVDAAVPGVGAVRPRVLFLCTGNSARSLIAEALLRDRSGGSVDVRSAGSHPKPVHPNALRVLRELGIDPTGLEPEPISRFESERFDRVISLCDKVREVCPTFPGDPETAHWSFADPSAGQTSARSGYPAFRALAAELDVRITFLLAAIAAEPRAA